MKPSFLGKTSKIREDELELTEDAFRKMEKEFKSDNLEEWERLNIIKVLKENNLEVQKSADALAISRSTLWRKIKKYNIQL